MIINSKDLSKITTDTGDPFFIKQGDYYEVAHVEFYGDLFIPNELIKPYVKDGFI